MIKSIDKSSVHRITSGQVLVDLQTAVKELVENSLDAGSTNIEVKFKDYGLKSFEVIDNGSGIAAEDYEYVALKHCTSKLSTFEDLTALQSFGFRGEALSSLCALSERVVVVTSTARDAPVGAVLEFDRTGRLKSASRKVARQRGTTVTVEGIFSPLPVRRKELERNVKREFGKALNLLTAYALVPCAKENKGVRLSVVNMLAGGKKSDQIRTDGKPSLRSAVSLIWGPKQLDSLMELDLKLEVVPEKMVLRRQQQQQADDAPTPGTTKIHVRGLISKPTHGNARSVADRQFFYINSRPCLPTKIQKAFNDVFRSVFASPYAGTGPGAGIGGSASGGGANSNTNAVSGSTGTQYPFIIADFSVPRDTCDVNVSPDKRTILLHSENALVESLRTALLEEVFGGQRRRFAVQGVSGIGRGATQVQTQTRTQSRMRVPSMLSHSDASSPILLDSEDAVAAATSSATESSGDPAGYTRVGVDAVAPLLSSDGILPDAWTSSSPPSEDHTDDRPVDPIAAVSLPAHILAADSVSSTAAPSPPTTASPAHVPDMCIHPEASAGCEHGAEPGLRTHPVVALPSPENAISSHYSLSRIRSPSPPALVPSRPVQMILDTSKASWALKPRSRGNDDEPTSRKKLRLENGAMKPQSPVKANAKAKIRLRSKILRYVAPSADGKGAIVDNSGASGEESSEEGDGNEDDGSEKQEVEINGEENGLIEEHGSNKDNKDFALPHRTRVQLQVEAEKHGEILSAQARQHSSSRVLDADSPRIGVGNGVGEQTLFLPEPDLLAPLPATEENDGDQPRPPSVDITDVETFAHAVNLPSVVTAATDAGAEQISDERLEVLRTADDISDSHMHCNLTRIERVWSRAPPREPAPSVKASRITAAKRDSVAPSAGLSNTSDEASAELELSRVIHKEDFARMEVVGQFNLGFIIARKRETTTTQGNATAGVADESGVEREEVDFDDLFIIDQHAADEKYNFETLQQTTKIASQKLVRPRPLELTAADAILAIENMEVLRNNGFEIEVDESSNGHGAVSDDEQEVEQTLTPSTQIRVKLVAQPVSGNTEFDIKDFEELLNLLRDRPASTATTVRCSKARAMFAMRACRKSIMIGMALNRPQMISVVRHMGTMDQPWNCPHGRPTMRHLICLKDLLHEESNYESRRRKRQVLEWGNL